MSHDPFNLGTGIRTLEVTNFRSFRKLHLELGRLNAFVGPNASGKSNVFHALRFLRDLAKEGLNDAISLQGGREFMAHMKHREEPTTFKVSYTERGDVPWAQLFFQTTQQDTMRFQGTHSEYSLRIGPSEADNANEYHIDEELAIRLYLQVDQPDVKKDPKESFLQLTFKRPGDEYTLDLDVPGFIDLRQNSLVDYLQKTRLPAQKNETLLGSGMSIFNFRPGSFFEHIPIFDFIPDDARDASSLATKAELEEDGENLPTIIRDILRSKELADNFMKIMHYVLPYITNVDVEDYSDQTTIFRMKESFSDDWLPADALSSGTIDVAALICAFYFTESPVIALEEPERYIHAALIPKIVDLLKSRSRDCQFLLTTHNSDMLSNLNDSTVYGLYRDRSGYSRAFRPSENRDLIILMEDDFDIADLNKMNILHGGE